VIRPEGITRMEFGPKCPVWRIGYSEITNAAMLPCDPTRISLIEYIGSLPVRPQEKL
jgi:hypothetical protein